MNRAAIAAIAVLTALLASGVGAAPTAAHVALTPAPGPHLHGAPATVPRGSGITAPPGAVARPPAPPSATGVGTFFSTTSVPAVAVGQQTCYYGTCVVAAEDPVVNVTSDGTVVAAYTAYTNQSPCAVARTAAQTEIGLVIAASVHGPWSTPLYLGNPDCSTPTVNEFPSAFEPTVTSLANGTIVLAYIEYNVTSGTIVPYADFGRYLYSVPNDRLVVTESYDDGATWATPTVVNESDNPALDGSAFAPQRPSLAANGSTIFLTWTNTTALLGAFASTGSGAVHVVRSTNGGVTWGAPTDLPTVVGSGGISVATNPSVTVGPGGVVAIAFTTDFTYHATYGCATYGCAYYLWTSDVDVAVSTNNGATYSVTTAAAGVLAGIRYYGTMGVDPSPTPAFDPSGSELYVVFAAGVTGTICATYGCYLGYGGENVFVANSSTGGTSWSAVHPVAPQLAGGAAYGLNTFYNPSVAVTATGALDVAFAYVNYSVCANGLSGYFCGPQYELFVNSTDAGLSFSTPLFVSDNGSQLLTNPDSPDGEYASMLSVGGDLLVAWTSDLCYGWNGTSAFSACYYPATGTASGIQLSTLFRGAGTSLTFTETGLPNGTPWSVDVLGNVRSGTAPTSLALSGVPVGLNVTWNLTTTAPYGTRYAGTSSLSAPYIVTGATIVATTFAAQFLLTISAVPALSAPPGYTVTYCFAGGTAFWDDPACPNINWNLTPAPGQIWVTPGTAVGLSAIPITKIACGTGAFCYSDDYVNATFLSWTGSGVGSVNTTANTTSVTVTGPVNETANFRSLGWCYTDFASTNVCFAPNVSVAFHENGLPTGSTWGVSISSDAAAQDFTGSSATLAVSGPVVGGLMSYTPWVVPASGGKEYVATSSSPASPIELPTGAYVEVNYTLVTTSSQSFAATLSAAGVPSGVDWGYSVDATSYASSNATAPTLELGAGSHTFAGTAVTLANGTRYTPSAVDVRSLSVGAGWTNTSGGTATVTVAAPVEVTVVESTEYNLSVAAGVGGSATPSSGWFAAGASVRLTATPDPGYRFVGWSGSGPGSGSGTGTTLNVVVAGPIRELASFAPIPLPSWNVTVTASGLTPDVVFSLGFGPSTYSGATSFVIPNVATGTYPLTVPDAYPNATLDTRYVGAVASTSYASGGSGVVIGASGWINLTFAPEYALVVQATSGGSVGPSGGGWYAAGTGLTFTATPDPGYVFAGWSGSGAGAVNATTATIDLSVLGPTVELATFVAAVAPGPAVYPVTLSETGLPAGTSWGVDLNGTTWTTTSSTLNLPLSNGSYTFTVPSVAGGTGTEYTPVASGYPAEVVGSGATIAVNFTTLYLVTVAASAGGRAIPSTGWYGAGTQLSFVATPDGGHTFSGWNATGPGGFSSTTATYTLTLAGPVSVGATFAPIYPPAAPAAASTPNGAAIAVGLLVVLLVVGAAVGLVLGRRRPPAEGTDLAPAEESPAEPWVEGPRGYGSDDVDPSEGPPPAEEPPTGG